MNLKKFLILFIFGFTAYWLLGGLFYGFIFASILPPMPEGENPEMMMYIMIGCAFMALLYAFIYSRIGGLNSYKDAIINGGLISMIMAASMHAFYFSLMPSWTPTQRVFDLFINFLMGGLTSSILFLVLDKIFKNKF